MSKKALIVSMLFFLAGLGIAAHQWFGWHYWDWHQQLSLHHHEGWALLLVVLGIITVIGSFLADKETKVSKKALIASTWFFLAGLSIASHQWFVWHYWDWHQQLSLLHHEGWSLLLIVLGIVMVISSFLAQKKHLTKVTERT